MSPIHTRQNHRRSVEQGFSLVEILVAVVIGLIGIVMMFLAMENFEARKRTTAAGGDAQVAGSIALFNLERDVRLAGNGFTKAATTTAASSDHPNLPAYLGCTVSAFDSQRPVPPWTFTFTPVQIIQGINGAPDQIVVLYGNGEIASFLQTFSAATTDQKKTSSYAGLRPGDLVIVAESATNCQLVEITANPRTDATITDGVTIKHSTGGPYTNSAGAIIATPRYNSGAVPASQSGALYNLGLGWSSPTMPASNLMPHRNIWRIRPTPAAPAVPGFGGRFLTIEDSLHYIDALDQTVSPAVAGTDGQNDWAEVGEGIINLQAEYGLDTNADTIVDTWTTATPANWNTVRAIRVALLSRSEHYESVGVTMNAPRWAERDAAHTFVMTNVDGTADSGAGSLGVNNWRNYHYRVYETVIPLRNLVWGTTP